VPRGHPPEFRARAIALAVRANRKADRSRAQYSSRHAVGVGEAGPHRSRRCSWSRTTESESVELRAARSRIRELETELVIVRQAAQFLGEDWPRPKSLPSDRPTRRRRGPADRCCWVLGVARQNHYRQ
jgi:transposase